MDQRRSLAQLMDLRGRFALITGGAGHVGRAFAEALAELGAGIVLLDLPGVADTAAAAVTAAHGVPAVAWGVDLEDSRAVGDVPKQVLAQTGRLDILVNCAALVGTSPLTGWAVPFEAQSIDTWRRALEVNVTAAFSLIQGFAPALRAGGHGSIINVASIYGVVGPDWRLYEGTSLGNPAAYAASKGALVQLTRWLATTLAPHIRVNAISPGGIERGTADPFLSRYVARVPMGRMGTEEDLKGAVAYLATDASAYMTGQNLLVDGGWTAW